MPHLTPSRLARRGTTLLEIALVCTVIAVLTAVAAPRIGALLDRIHVRGAVDEIAAACSTARHLAILRGRFVTVTVDDAAGTVVVEAAGDTVVRRELASTFGVALSATRDALTYAPTGLGYGVSNLRVIISRGHAIDTLFVSRLGRVKR